MQEAEKIYELHLTEREMQNIVYAITGFYRRTNAEKLSIDPNQTAVLLNAFKKFKAVVDGIRQPPLTDKDSQIEKATERQEEAPEQTQTPIGLTAGHSQSPIVQPETKIYFP